MTTPALRDSFGRCVQPRRILLVEDGVINRVVAENMLRSRGHHVVSVPSGIEAIERLGEAAFDLVLMDVQMPELDGFETTQRIRQTLAEPTRDIPIIAMTAHAMSGDRVRCIDAGMNDYISKPYTPERLFAAVESIVTDQPTDIIFVDAVVLRQTLGDDPEILQLMSETFAEQWPAQIADLSAAIATGEAHRVADCAHQLKGSAAALGATGLQKAAGALETEARQWQAMQPSGGELSQPGGGEFAQHGGGEALPAERWSTASNTLRCGGESVAAQLGQLARHCESPPTSESSPPVPRT